MSADLVPTLTENLATQISDSYGNEIALLIDAIRILVERDRAAYIHQTAQKEGQINMAKDLILHSLDSCLEHLSNASLAWYASTE
jgi:CTP-dependent riboflavin kinase